MNHVRDLIQKHGGTVKFADACKVNKQTVSNWITRNRIPVKNWPNLVRSGIDRSDLVEVHVCRPEETLQAAE